MKKKVFPKLYALSSDGRQKEWEVSVHEREDGVCLIRRTHGFTGCKMQTTNKSVKSGKNIGKKNETTIWEQAIFDAQSLWNKKKDRAYGEGKPKKEDPKPLPMLALPFEKRKHNIKYPCFVQPKLNGVRCFARKVDKKTIEYTSRNGKVYDTLEHLTPYLLKSMEVGDIVDGEIYVHGMTFQQIVRLVKKLRPESSKLQYHIYDKADPGKSYNDRYLWLEDNIGPNSMSDKSPLWLVSTYKVDSEKKVYEFHNKWVADAYEGVIIRNSGGKYKFRHRSKDLQKYKEFQDEEFVIVGGKAATGVHKGCVVFECGYKKTDGTKDTFDVSPKATLEQRREMLKDLKKYIGKKLTVRFQEKSEDNAPIFPVGITVRDYE